jgi:hypothetical protein
MKNILSPCQAHDNQTHIVEIDGEKWRVELVEKVVEPMFASEWYNKNKGEFVNRFDAMNQYAAYRLEFYKKHGI